MIVSDWLGRFASSLGIDVEVVQHFNQIRFRFERPVILYFAALAAVGLAALRHWRHRDVLKRKSDRLLGVLRCCSVLAVIFALARPKVAVDVELVRKPVLVFAVDVSESMQLPNGKTAVPSRLQFALDSLRTTHAAAFAELSERFDLRCLKFSESAVAISDLAGLESAPAGVATSLAAALDGADRLAKDAPLAGVAIVSDGQDSSSQPPLELARKIRELSGKVVCIAAGPSKRVVDVSIVEASAVGQVFVGDIARVVASIESAGLDDLTVPVELRDGEKVLDRREMALRSGERQRLELSAVMPVAGEHFFTVVIPRQLGEMDALAANNSEVVPVSVTADKRRALFVDRLPRWDFRFLRNAMRRDLSLAGIGDEPVAIRLESEASGRAFADAMRADVDRLGRYHVIVLGDLDGKSLSGDAHRKLVELVETNGVGLIVAMGPWLASSCPDHFQSLLPLRWNAAASRPAEMPRDGLKFLPSPEGQAHEVLQLGDSPPSSMEIWRSFGPTFWALAGCRPKADATVLANAVNADASSTAWPTSPVLAWRRAGKGKVLMLGMDSTWRWRQNVGDRHFYRFWKQAMAFVAREDEEAAARTRIHFQPARPRLGTEAKATLDAFLSDRTPRMEPIQEIEIASAASRQSIELRADSAKRGRYFGNWNVAASGEYHIRFAPREGPQANRRILVSPCPTEFRKPNVQRETLRLLAEVGGGAVLEWQDFAKIGRQFDRPPSKRRLQKNISLWDNWLVLSVAASFFIANIAARRWRGLA